MKKSAILLSSFLGFSAFAGDFTIYGTVDAGIKRATGINEGPITAVVNSVSQASVLGFKGTENLDSGFKAIFTLENQFESDTGSLSNKPLSGNKLPDRFTSPTALGLPDTEQTRAAVSSINIQMANSGLGSNIQSTLFHRQAFVGLVTPAGVLLAGNQYLPAYEILYNYDITGTESDLSASQLAGAVDVRSSNSIGYRAEHDNVTGYLVHGFSENNQSGGKLSSAGFMYKSKFISSGIGYSTRDNEFSQKSLHSTVIGLKGTLSRHTISIMGINFKDENPAGLSVLSAPFFEAFSAALRQDGRIIHVGYKYEFGSNTAFFALNKFNDKSRANIDSSSYGIGLRHSFSKRTDINMYLTKINNSANAQLSVGGGVSSTPGQDSASLALGIKHSF